MSKATTIALALLSLLPACKGKNAAKPPSEPRAPAPAPGPGSAAIAIDAAGPTALDLNGQAHPLPATVVAPPGVTVTSDEEFNTRSDGFTYATSQVHLSGAGLPGVVTLSTATRLGWTPTTLADDKAQIRHELVASEEGPAGNWAASYKLTDSCYIHAWAPSAKIWCEAAAERMVGVPCDRVREVIPICLSIAAKGTMPEPRLAADKDLRNVTDPKAIEAAVAVGRAIVANDLAAFSAVATGKVTVGKRKLDAAGLAAAVTKAGSLGRLFGQDCAEPGQACRWNSDDDGSAGKVTVVARDGYGEIPGFELVRQPDGAWKVSAFRTIDYGSP